MACITIPVTDVSPGPLQRLCLKGCPSKSACEAPRRDRGREAYLDPCLEEELHRRLYTSRVGTRGPAPSSKTDLYGLDLVSLQELCSAVAEHLCAGTSLLQYGISLPLADNVWFIGVGPWPDPVLTFPPLHHRRLTLSDAGSQPKNCAGELTAAIYPDEAVLGLRIGTSD
ncbi:hypothetical protein QBC45DRAFT_455450 [Copromyces sp. CBS 386.78]|nr:hypothetical protein QBC45DRAFT_455450 [Copromyces sp. CBS 386.78]